MVTYILQVPERLVFLLKRNYVVYIDPQIEKQKAIDLTS